MKKIKFKLSGIGIGSIMLLLFSCTNGTTSQEATSKTEVVKTSNNELPAATSDPNLSEETTNSAIELLPNPSEEKVALPYQFNSPNNTLSLSGQLVEISGLSYLASTNQLLAVNDELGYIYFLNTTSGKIEKTIDFGSRGDYEGVELVGNDVFVVKSNGTVYAYDLKKDLKVKPKKTALNSSNDVEGLGYDSDANELLLACKGNWDLKNSKSKKIKAIYRFDLEEYKLKKKPAFKIADKTLEKYVEYYFSEEDFSKKELSKLENRANDFSPSGIAIHPHNKDIYILSSSGKMLVVLNKNEELKAIEFLDSKIHRQPEGICFSPDGDLYISNEGKGLSAKIYHYIL